ncbi:ATP-binding protein [Xanthomonas campestris pv. phormiicola]|nr:ATP-binding protein [Xanthomonas campestris pv. phormiicola]UYC16824.1 ATP-binding protein [Xanthomonas campestris pv. phormiicola]
MHINPDRFLQIETGRVVTPECNQAAWTKSYQVLDEALRNAGSFQQSLRACRPAGCGRERLAKSVASTLRGAIIFDAILVEQAERQPIVAAARSHPVEALAVWFKTPLEACLSGNASRPADEVVAEQAVRNVHSAIEPPSLIEGFAKVIEVQ